MKGRGLYKTGKCEDALLFNILICKITRELYVQQQVCQITLQNGLENTKKRREKKNFIFLIDSTFLLRQRWVLKD